jgi:protein-S-isoprenylcysteine O-methyltransferase Ste14
VAKFERLFVWAGGALFVASLVFCAYSYLVRWSAASAGGGWPAYVVNSVLLSVFALHHSLFARDRVKRWLARRLPEPLLRSVYVWTAALLLIVACAFWQPISSDLYQVHGGRTVLHAIVQLLGLWLIARAVATIDPLDLAGIRPRKAAERLQVVGPYRLVRHPVYFGWVLVVFGASHMTGERFAFAILTTLYIAIAIPWEERSLTAAFGEDYERYKQQVRWKLVPYIY